MMSNNFMSKLRQQQLQMIHQQIDSHRSSNINGKINLLLSQTRYSQEKNNRAGPSPVKFRMTHKTYHAKNSKKIKSEAQSPEHAQTNNKQSITHRKSVNLKTESIFTERRHRKNSINAIIERKCNGGTIAALGNHSPQKMKIKTSGLVITQQDTERSVGKLSQRLELMKKTSYQTQKEVASSNQLTEFELQQIKKFPIYYKGPRRIKNKKQFTDPDGNVLIKKNDAVAYRYQVMQILGKGAFGKVFKAYDHKKKQMVALKVIKAVPKLNQQAKIEISILEKAVIQDEEGRSNIVKMKGSFIFRGHTCISYQILSKNLYEYIKDSNFQPTPQKIMVKFAIQILHSLMFLSNNNIVHCDIKPENIMLRDQSKTGIRVIDLGSSCYQQDQFYTYIQSRFYRAPEIILGIRYTPAIDMWSFGLVLAELLTGYPLFPGESEEEQLLMYMEIFGFPPTPMLEAGSRRKRFFNDKLECRIIQSKQHYRIPKSLGLERALGDHASKSLLDLIRRCLEWDPTKRITPKQALLHEWVLTGIPQQIRARHIKEVTGEGLDI